MTLSYGESSSVGDLNEDEGAVCSFGYAIGFPNAGCSCPTGNRGNITAEYARKRSRVPKARKRLRLLCGERLQGPSEIQRFFSQHDA
jgi:hypothetical protein